MTKLFFIVGAGSFLGGGTRYLVQQLVAKHFASPMPYGTLVVNILGSFIIGILFALSEKTTVLSNEMRMFLATGFCGGFTTFSAFSLENINLLREGSHFYVLGYVSLSVVLGFSATYLGLILAKQYL